MRRPRSLPFSSFRRRLTRCGMSFGLFFLFLFYLPGARCGWALHVQGTPLSGRAHHSLHAGFSGLVASPAQRGGGQASLPGQQRQHRLVPGSALSESGSLRGAGLGARTYW
ncbi:hypothetical protein NDU88_001433 [Pleurodeles waltl]|uniref:Secreted protein n=1 Tax=Pleurodeles waltl TaxID=8319 RepID=A0AAV7MKG3_PLEWA|nr:hypothetical protein NDU88_001433 [Pleurodeles waltl]